MKERLLAGLYGLSDPRLVSMAVVVVGAALAALALLGAILPTHPGLLAPASGGTSNC